MTRLMYKLFCWAGFHKWTYYNARNRKCLRCPAQERRAGMEGLQEIWVPSTEIEP